MTTCKRCGHDWFDDHRNWLWGRPCYHILFPMLIAYPDEGDIEMLGDRAALAFVKTVFDPRLFEGEIQYRYREQRRRAE